jgi:CRP/FNR family transcriptional regulator, cyclic AMP receptor protein
MKEEELLFKKFGRFFAKGTVLFEEGQTCLGMFIIQKGRVRLFKKAGKKEMTIDILGPGEFFGEMACLIGQPRSIHAIVEEASQILVIQPPVLEELFRGNPGMSMKIIANLASRLRKAYEIIEEQVAERERQTPKEFCES